MPLVLSAEQMRAIDRAATERLGVPSLLLIENAGRGVAEVIARERAPRGLDVRVVCGAGQNGGDGFVIARHLANAGARVTVLLAAPTGKLAGDAALNARAVGAMARIAVRDEGTTTDGDAWRARLAGADVLVDAVFGTGLRADVTGAPAAAIAAMNATRALRVAVDLPSGLDADTGRVRGTAVDAHVTATMGAHKLGLVLDAEAPVGRVAVVDLGVAIEDLADAAPGPLCHLSDAGEMAALVPRRSPSAHKGTAGHVLVVAGSPGKTGAALLVARGAHRAGAGLVTVASTRAGQAALDAKVLETMTGVYADGDDADAGSYDRIARLAERMKAVALGPGIPVGPGMKALVTRMVAELPVPMVVDADGLNLLGPEGARLAAAAPAPRVFTPHPGEAARLAGAAIAEVQGDRLGHARRLAAASGAVVALKGARTIVARPDGVAHVDPTANPALGTAGSGDVLTGVVTALLGQGLGPVDAARLGVFAHGAAAGVATRTLGARNLVAGDLPDAVARALEDLLALAGGDGDGRAG